MSSRIATVGMGQDPKAPEKVVERQLDAYNARDLEAFMACWADTALFLAWPDVVVEDGAAAIRERHRVRFRDDSLRADLLGRVALEEVVVDRERVTRLFPEGLGTAEVIAIYEVRDGLIQSARFKQGKVSLLDPGR